MVADGSDVKAQAYDYAFFEKLASSLASLAASNMVDAMRLALGCAADTADAEQAYTQAELKGVTTWIRLPSSWISKVLISRIGLWGAYLMKEHQSRVRV